MADVEDAATSVNNPDVPQFSLNTEEFVLSMRNPNTVRKTQSDVKKFSDFLQKELEETRAIEQISASQLDVYLARFFMTARKHDGDEYEPDSLKQFRCSINPS